MSDVAKLDLMCPKCAKSFPVTYWTSVNVTIDPQLRQRVFDGSIRYHDCVHCGQGVLLQSPLLYHDTTRRFMVFFQAECRDRPITWNTKFLEDSARVLPHYQFRFVTSWGDLIEKINIFENGWDDRILETLKLLVVERLFPVGSPEFNQSTAHLTRLVDDGSEWPAFHFEIRRGDTVIGQGTVPSELYDKLVDGQEARFGKNYGAGEWTMVNKATILSQGPNEAKQRTAPRSDGCVFSRQPSKTDLIRSLLKARLRDDPMAKMAGVSPASIDYSIRTAREYFERA